LDTLFTLRTGRTLRTVGTGRANRALIALRTFGTNKRLKPFGLSSDKTIIDGNLIGAITIGTVGTCGTSRTGRALFTLRTFHTLCTGRAFERSKPFGLSADKTVLNGNFISTGTGRTGRAYLTTTPATASAINDRRRRQRRGFRTARNRRANGLDHDIDPYRIG
jgi:hypothetical protein